MEIAKVLRYRKREDAFLWLAEGEVTPHSIASRSHTNSIRFNVTKLWPLPKKVFAEARVSRRVKEI
jgi:hypothetical protein